MLSSASLWNNWFFPDTWLVILALKRLRETDVNSEMYLYHDAELLQSSEPKVDNSSPLTVSSVFTLTIRCRCCIWNFLVHNLFTNVHESSRAFMSIYESSHESSQLCCSGWDYGDIMCFAQHISAGSFRPPLHPYTPTPTPWHYLTCQLCCITWDPLSSILTANFGSKLLFLVP